MLWSLGKTFLPIKYNTSSVSNRCSYLKKNWIRHINFGWYHKKSLKDYSLLIKGVSETVENEAKVPKEGFLSILTATLGAGL